MRYALLAYRSPDLWARLSHEEHAAWWVDGAALDAQLADRAAVVTELGLVDPTAATTVKVRNGEALVDRAAAVAPLASALVVDVPGLAVAVDLAVWSPAARTGWVEVRRVA